MPQTPHWDSARPSASNTAHTGTRASVLSHTPPTGIYMHITHGVLTIYYWNSGRLLRPARLAVRCPLALAFVDARGAARGDAAEQQGEQPVEPLLGLGQPVQLHGESGQHVQAEAVALGGREACRVLGRGREQREVARRRRRSSSGGGSGAWSGSAHTSGSSQPSALSVSKKRCGRAVPVKPTTRLRASRAAA